MESLLYPSARQPPPLAAARRSREDPSLRALAALHWPQYIAILLLGAALAVSGHAAPFFETHAPIYGDISLVYVHYSYPQLPTPQVPDWVLPLVALGLPLFVLASAWGSGWIRRREAHHCRVAVVACVVTAALLNNLIKMQVGRLRPDFVARCWPTTHTPAFSADGVPKCDAEADLAAVRMGMRSFPSKHSAWSAAGLGFLSLWLAGKLRCFGSNDVRPGAIVLSLLPLLVAGWMGLIRVQAYKHHLSDVAAGLFLGLAVAWVFYRHIFVSALSRHPGKLSAEVAEAEEEEAWAGEASGVRLSGSAEHLLAAAGHPASPDVQPAEESV